MGEGARRTKEELVRRREGSGSSRSRRGIEAVFCVDGVMGETNKKMTARTTVIK